jgi:CheY-like chemotaxis protein
MTGYGQQSDREHTLAAGFDAHLTKPVGIEQIEQLLLQATAG